jgi:hypothetical protein
MAEPKGNPPKDSDKEDTPFHAAYRAYLEGIKSYWSNLDVGAIDLSCSQQGAGSGYPCGPCWPNPALTCTMCFPCGAPPALSCQGVCTMCYSCGTPQGVLCQGIVTTMCFACSAGAIPSHPAPGWVCTMCYPCGPALTCTMCYPCGPSGMPFTCTMCYPCGAPPSRP